MTQKIRISVGLNTEEYSLLEKKAQTLEVSMSWLARKIIIDAIKPELHQNLSNSIDKIENLKREE